MASVFLAVAGAASLSAQITVENIADRQIYDNQVSFRVPSQAGFDYLVTLDGQPVPTGLMIPVTTMDYHEVFVQRTETATGAETERRVRFIVRSTNRGSPETGLMEWTPYPLVGSTAGEVAGAQLHVVAPLAYPMDLPIPVIAWLDDGAGREWRANGLVNLSGYGNHTLKLLRGIGSVVLPGASDNDPISLTASLHALQTNKVIVTDVLTAWSPVAGVQAGTRTWPENSRMHLTGHVGVPAGSSLTIGAGTVVKLERFVTITNRGTIHINGTPDRPVVFTATGPVAPDNNTYAWGGFIIRGASAEFVAQGTIFNGGGGGVNFGSELGPSHKSHQPVLLMSDQAEVALTNCYIINTAGQMGNGLDADFTLDHCLVQKAVTGGEYEGGTQIINHSAIIEFPEANGQVNATIADYDYDGIYFTLGTHILVNSMFGFCKDDAIDSGSGGAGTVVVSNCWVEAALHEALAWSGGGRVTWTYDSVLINNGQGIECGWSTGSDSPLCYAGNLLSLGNSVGARYGDNYTGTSGLGLKTGFLWVTNSFILNNHRDIWGQVWDNTWDYRSNRMDLHDNFVTTENPHHPDNTLWQPATEGWRLGAFMRTPPTAPVGVGLAVWTNQFAMSALADGVPVRLSSFTTLPVGVDYTITDTAEAVLATGTLTFAAGETVKRIYATGFNLQNFPLVHVNLSGAANGELTGQTRATFQGTVPLPQLSLAGVSAPLLPGRRMVEGTFLYADRVPAGLVSVNYTYTSFGTNVESGTFVFNPPAQWKSLLPMTVNAFDYRLLDLTLSNPTGATWTGVTSVSFTNAPLAMSFAGTANQLSLDALSNGIPVQLSGPAPSGVGVDYVIEGAAGVLTNGRLDFLEGEAQALLPAPAGDYTPFDILRVTLSNPTGAPLEGLATIYLVRPPAPPPVPTNAVFVARGAAWNYWDTGSDLGTAWRSNSFDDATWPAGPAQLGFSNGEEGDEATLIADNDQITTYFRRSFVVANPAALDQLSLWVLRDDGAVVYLNGAEVFRSPNLPAGEINYLTTTVGSNGENTEDTATISASVLQPGTNWIAVEIHQQAADSSDVSFDLELVEVPGQSGPLVARGAQWRYRDAASAAPADWNQLSFDASGWPEGPAQLGFGESDQATPIADNNQITSYFRHTFTVADPTDFADLAMWMLRDDGGVVYLNGTEVYRSPNIPTGTISYNTLTVSGENGENTIDTATLSAAALQAGANVVAVEIHQQDATSSDVSFDFELVGNPAPPPVPQYVYLSRFGGVLVLAWSEATFALEEADQVTGPWRAAASNSPLVLAPGDQQKFYRLRQ